MKTHTAYRCSLTCGGLLLFFGGCTPVPGNGGGTPTPVWEAAFNVSETGALSAVWGSGPADVFAVGGTPGQGEVYHFDGTTWTSMTVPTVPLLVWVFGLGPDDVFAVGEDGGALHYDGSTWQLLNTGTTADLWGVWGSSRESLWVVGGDAAAGEPVILLFNGTEFSSVAVPANDRNATSLFKVWGIGSKVFAVGGNGLIIEFANGAWSQVPAGAAADDDFVSLWGTSESNIVAVGGRSSARIARYDGTQWTTELFSGTPGLNAVFMVESGQAIVGGTNGYAGRFDPLTGSLEAESSTTNLCIHGLWGDGQGSFYAVGGRFSDPYEGLALVRTLSDDPNDPGSTPSDDDCTSDEDCSADQTCTAGTCVPLAGNGSGDACAFEAECVLGENCVSGGCSSSDGPDIQYWALVGSSFGPVDEGGILPVRMGFQGGVHTFVSVRTTGFPPGATAFLSTELTLVEDGSTVIALQTLSQGFTDLGNGVNEAQGVFTRLGTAQPGEVDGKMAVISLQVTDIADEAITASLTQTVQLVEVDIP